jgi:hypothetical protein
MEFSIPHLYGYVPPPSNALSEHARALYERRDEAIVVPFVSVKDGDWRPTAQDCHENCETWCERHQDHGLVRGWIYVPLAGLAYCRFVAHTVIRRPYGELIDITPTGTIWQSAPYRFLSTIVSRVEYESLVIALYDATGAADLDWRDAAGD